MLASEFRYCDPIIDDKTLVIVISQSGETLDTMAALREAKRAAARGRSSIVNVVGSSIARESDDVLYTWAGPEIAVATTKAYCHADGRHRSARRLYWPHSWARLSEEEEAPPHGSHCRTCPTQVEQILSSTRADPVLRRRSTLTTTPCSSSAGIWTMRSAWRVL